MPLGLLLPLSSAGGAVAKRAAGGGVEPPRRYSEEPGRRLPRRKTPRTVGTEGRVELVIESTGVHPFPRGPICLNRFARSPGSWASSFLDGRRAFPELFARVVMSSPLFPFTVAGPRRSFTGF